MVLPNVQTASHPATTQQAQPNLITCPRCSNQLRITYPDQEPECWMCGFVDYSRTPKVKTGKSILAAGTQFLVRYIGKFPAMTEKLVHVRVTRGTGAAKIKPVCPFCQRSMEMVLFVGKRKTLAEDRYACNQGHRISLLRGPNGDMGWK